MMVPGFFAGWHTYACARSRFDEQVVLLGRAWVNEATVGRWSRVRGRLSTCTIGAFCSIAEQAVVGGLGRHPTDQVSSHSAFCMSPEHLYPQRSLAGESRFTGMVPPTTLGNDVWVAFRGMVLNGVTVGDGAIIAAGAVVTRDVPPYAIVAGVPARVVRYRFEDPELRAALSASRWWEWPAERLVHIGDAFDQGHSLTLPRWQAIVDRSVTAPPK